jgi:hypothetical protein
MSRQLRQPAFGRIERCVLSLLVPDARRESFEGDLLEGIERDALSERAARARVRRELLRSAPALLFHPEHVSPARRRLALHLAPMVLFVTGFVAWSNNVADAPPATWIGFATGTLVMTLGLAIATAAVRTLALAVGVAALLIGQMLAGDALGPGIYLIYVFPGSLYAILPNGRTACRRESRLS